MDKKEIEEALNRVLILRDEKSRNLVFEIAKKNGVPELTIASLIVWAYRTKDVAKRKGADTPENAVKEAMKHWNIDEGDEQ